MGKQSKIEPWEPSLLYELNISAAIKYLDKIHKDDWTIENVSSALHTGFFQVREWLK